MIGADNLRIIFAVPLTSIVWRWVKKRFRRLVVSYPVPPLLSSSARDEVKSPSR